MPSIPARADGGPIVGPYLWKILEEGQQIAVVTLVDTETAKIDLFISILDSSGESHEIVFFIPLGAEAGEFYVRETDSLNFDERNTYRWDVALNEETKSRHETISYLFGATLLTNGIWVMPLWLPLIFSGCGAPPPEATFDTDSSQISIYGLDEDTDLESLISVTGLDASVRETLSRLRGQKIAVVNLNTEVKEAGDGTGGYRDTGDPGIHLSWTTSLIQGEEGASYAYPLGTGTAWYHPVKMTRVYVIAPPGIDFSVEYPELGSERSGYVRVFGGYQERIYKNYDVAAYAVDEAKGDFGRIWRAVYTQSNAGEDIVVTARPQSSIDRFFTGLQKGRSPGLIIMYIIALGLWLLAWRYLGPRLLPDSYQGNPKKFWKVALFYTGVNVILMIPGVILYAMWLWTGISVTLAFLFILFGGVSLIVFAASRVKQLGLTFKQAIKAYSIVTLVSNGAYLILALAYIKITGVI